MTALNESTGESLILGFQKPETSLRDWTRGFCPIPGPKKGGMMEILKLFFEDYPSAIVGAFIGGLIVLGSLYERFNNRLSKIQESISGALNEHITIDEFLEDLETGHIEIKRISGEIRGWKGGA
jgi:hypothetical protein